MMADHMDEPPQKRVKMDDLFLLEENLPDELVLSNNNWGEQLNTGGGVPNSGNGGGGGAGMVGIGVGMGVGVGNASGGGGGGSGGPNHGNMGVNVVGGPNKPPAQGPGPGPGSGPQMNGSADDVSVNSNNPLRQMQHHQHLQHLLQQQVNL